ncbi:hypothetical protein BGZ93_009902 [Podila epicladia]|nr:hypothetical protein BGZ92_010422 [Podila epicladia]KAG0089378.1 hypothetical protein BGZ93_009902 [Podila epicladia]
MKSFLPLFLVAWLACLHQALAQATIPPLATSSSGARPTTNNTASPPVATPTPPAFVNTPGLQVTSPFSGVILAQNTRLTIALNLAGNKPIASVNVSVGKKDGTLNTTIVDLKGLSTLRVIESWNVTAATFTPGDYLFNIIVTPNTTAIPSTPPPAGTGNSTLPTSTSSAAPPAQPTAGPQIYYWQGTIRVALPARGNGNVDSAGNVLVSGKGLMIQMATALGVLALGCALAI